MTRASGEENRADGPHPALAAFLAAMTSDMPELRGPELLPTRLAVAMVNALPVHGAGLSLISDGFRVPLGASDTQAASAERLQFTTGEGPCWQALHERNEVRATEDDIALRWPAFYAELLRASEFRSIASIPLRVTPMLHGAIDLYFRDPVGALNVDLDAASDVAAHCASILRLDPSRQPSSFDDPERMVPAGRTVRAR